MMIMVDQERYHPDLDLSIVLKLTEPIPYP